MTFLAPITGLVAAGLGLAGLAVFYLLRLRRRTLRVGSTLLWQEAASDLQVNVPFRWLRLSWLLLVHTILVLLLATALGRPAAELPGPGADRVFIAIDRSASMNAPASADTPGITRLDAARERALQIIDDLRGSPVVSVITVDARPALAAPPSDLRAQSRDAIRAVEPTDQPADLDAAIELIAGLSAGAPAGAEGAGDDTAAREVPVILLTDANLEPRDGVAFPGLRLAIERVDAPGEPTPTNLGIADIAVSRDLDDTNTARLFVRLVSTAPRETAAALRVGVDGVARTTESVRIPGVEQGAPSTSSQGTDASVRSRNGTPTLGETTHTFRIDEPGAAVLTVTIDRDDALPADNTASVLLPSATLPGTLVLAPPGPDGRPRPDRYLMDFLGALDPERLTFLSDPVQAAAAARSGSYGLAVLDRVAPPRPLPIPSLAFGTLPWNADPAPAWTGPTPFLAWDRTHPAMLYVAFDGVAIDRALRLPQGDETLEAPGLSAPLRVTELATGREAPLIATLTAPGVRHLVVGFDLAESTWPVHYTFPITLGLAVEWLVARAENDARAAASTADPVTLTGDLAERARAAGALSGPAEIPVPSGPDDGPGVAPSVTLAPITRAGLYQAGPGTAAGIPTGTGTGTGDASASVPLDPERTLAVNLTDPFESALAPVWSPDSTAIVQGAAGLRARTEIWHWFVMAALPLLLLEWLAYARQSRLR